METATAAAGAARTVTQAEPHAQAGGAAREGRRRTAHAPPHGQQEPPQGKRGEGAGWSAAASISKASVSTTLPTKVRTSVTKAQRAADSLSLPRS